MRKYSADVVNNMCRRYVTRQTILCRGFYLKKCDRAALDVDCSRTDISCKPTQHAQVDTSINIVFDWRMLSLDVRDGQIAAPRL